MGKKKGKAKRRAKKVVSEPSSSIQIAKNTKARKTLHLQVVGMTSSRRIEAVSKSIETLLGIVSQDLQPSGAAVIVYNPDFISPKQIRSAIRDAGYQSIEQSPSFTTEQSKLRTFLSRRAIVSAILTLLLLYMTFFGPLFGLPTLDPDETITVIVQLFLATPVFLFGWGFFRKSLKELKNKRMNMSTLVTSAAFFGYGFSLISVVARLLGNSKGTLLFDITVLLLTLVYMGDLMHIRTKQSNELAVSKMFEEKKSKITVHRGKMEMQVSEGEIQPHDRVILKAGDTIPVDGVVDQGHGSIDERVLSGNPLAVEVKKGRNVQAGSILKTGSIVVNANKNAAESTVSGLTTMAKQIQTTLPVVGNVADRTAMYFLYISLVTGFAAFIVGMLKGNGGLTSFGFVAGVALISCPAALTLANAIPVRAATNKGKEHGILLLNDTRLEQIKKVDTLVVGKTGVLTTGKLKVVDTVASQGLHEFDVLQYAGIALKRSNHALRDLILTTAAEKKIRVPEPHKFKVFPALGLEVKYRKENIRIGTKAWLKKKKVSTRKFDAKIKELENLGKIVLVVGVDKKVAGLILIEDPLKENVQQVVTQLCTIEKEVILMSGDTPAATKGTGKRAGIVTVAAGLSPEEKVKYISQLQAKGKKVMMIGSGIGDAPSLAQADIGIAVETQSSLVAQSADMLITKRNAEALVAGIDLSRYMSKKVRMNLWVAFALHALGIPIATGVLRGAGLWLSPPFAVSIAGISTLGILFNSVFMKRYKSV